MTNSIVSIFSINKFSLVLIEAKFFLCLNLVRGLVNITIVLQNKFLIEFSDNLVYNTFNLNKKE